MAEASARAVVADAKAVRWFVAREFRTIVDISLHIGNAQCVGG